jgi:molecular chaperone DnaK (HSP70)
MRPFSIDDIQFQYMIIIIRKVSSTTNRREIMSISTLTDEQAKQMLDEGQKKLSALNSRRERAQARIDMAKEELVRLQQKAQEEYGTSDLQELSAKVQAWRQENSEAVRKFTTDLDEYERSISDAERALGIAG